MLGTPYPPLHRFATDAATVQGVSPAPKGSVSDLQATQFSVKAMAVSGVSGTTLRLQTRALGSADAWVTKASDATPAVDDVLNATGLTQDSPLEWRLIEEDAFGNFGDGVHGITVPSTSPWATLVSTVKTALEGQGMASGSVYIGRQPEPNYKDAVAIVRTLRERVDARANNVERVVFAVEVEFRATLVDDQGDDQKVEIEKWQERLRTALHEKHVADFPGIPGLEEILVEVVTKDEREGRVDDEYQEDVRARARVLFAIWRNK